MNKNLLDHQNKKIAFIGAGNMAQAIIAGLVKSGWPAELIVASNPSRDKLELLQTSHGIRITQDNQDAAKDADIILLAVKPQKMADACSAIKHLDLSAKLIISVAAGVPTNKLNTLLDDSLAIVRCMPNTPAFISQGATGLYANQKVSDEQKSLSESIFNAVGESSWIDSEGLMDTVTAIAGSSPAYFFLMMQSMVEAAMKTGMPEKTAFDLITQAMRGAAELAQSTPQKSLDQLRKEVTSPGGTTAAAITSFKSDQFEDIVKKAVAASIQRGKELGQLN